MDEVIRKEDAEDHYEDVLGSYLVKLSGHELSAADNRTINTLLHTIGDFERITDHAVNLTETAREIRDKGHPFQRRGAGRPRGAGSRRAGHPQPHGGQ